MSFVSSNRTTFLFLMVAVALIFLIPLLVELPDEGKKKEETDAACCEDLPSEKVTDSIPAKL